MQLNPIDHRIIKLIDLLKFKGKLSTMEDFYTKIGISRATFSKIKNGYPNHFTVTHIENVCKIYNVNANWILGLEETIFLDETAQKLHK